MQNTIEDYIDSFIHLNVNRQYGKAPHKAILLLSIIDLIEEGYIYSSRVYMNEFLIEKFGSLWKRYALHIEYYIQDICAPFLFMESEPFYKLKFKDENWKGKPNWKNTKSIERVRDIVDYAEIDNDIFVLLQDEKNRSRTRVALINTYLI